CPQNIGPKLIFLHNLHPIIYAFSSNKPSLRGIFQGGLAINQCTGIHIYSMCIFQIKPENRLLFFLKFRKTKSTKPVFTKGSPENTGQFRYAFNAAAF